MSTNPPGHHDKDPSSSGCKDPIDSQAGAVQPVEILADPRIALIETDRERRIMLCNCGAEELLGYSRAELLKQPLAMIIPESVEWRFFADSPPAGRLPAVYVRKDGSTFTAITEWAPLKTADGIALVIRHNAIRLSLPSPDPSPVPDALLHLIQDAAIVTDPTIRVRGWNAAAEDLYGWSAAEALGHPLHDLLRTNYLGKARAQLFQQLLDHGVWRGEVIHHHRDGHPIAIQATVAVVRGSGGDPVSIVTVNRDISEQKRTEDALRKSEAKLRAVFNSLVEGVVFLNPQGEVEEANDAIQRLHGHTLQELADPQTDPRSRIVRNDGSPFPEDEQPAIVALRTGQAVRDIEMGVPAGDGSFRWRIVNAQPVGDTDGTLLGVVASFFDITERKRAEQEGRRSGERLQILSEASRVFAEAGTDYATVLDRIADTLVALMGDGSIIALISDDGSWLQSSHVYDIDPDVQELTRNLISGKRRLEESTTNARVFQTGEPLLIPIVNQNQLRDAAKPEYAAMIERQGYHSLIVVPMRALGRVIGVLTLYRRRRERPRSMPMISAWLRIWLIALPWPSAMPISFSKFRPNCSNAGRPRKSMNSSTWPANSWRVRWGKTRCLTRCSTCSINLSPMTAPILCCRTAPILFASATCEGTKPGPTPKRLRP
ncbi:MAG: PAS domain S-box protein [Blastochloris sp.]|nr:PAS domain S-box protein [Blastochloris sp.]